MNVQKSEGYGLKYNFQYTTTSMNVYHIFDFIDYMMNKNHITDSDQIDFYYAWSPNEVALSYLPNLEKNKIEKFLNKNKVNYSEKTQTEIDSIINYMNSLDISNIDGWEDGSRLHYIRSMEEVHGGQFEDISPVKIS